MISSTPEENILFPEDSKENFNLHCPSCSGEEFKVIPLSGKDGEYFVRITCNNCGEHFFFQNPFSLNSKIELDKVDGKNKLKYISYLQKEWNEWVTWKQRHLKSHSSGKKKIRSMHNFA